ncbi:MAG: zf-HC2 domain-containing protein [Pseudomonadota bacterium]
MMIPLQRTCKEVAAILISREDRKLAFKDRLALRVHMAICSACPRFERQLLIMRNGLRGWRNYSESNESTKP